MRSSKGFVRNGGGSGQLFLRAFSISWIPGGNLDRWGFHRNFGVVVEGLLNLHGDFCVYSAAVDPSSEF